MIKDAANTNIEWNIYYDEASPFNEMDDYLAAASTAAEATNVSTRKLDFLSNGFKIRNGTYGQTNGNAQQHIFWAIAEQPFKYANAR